MVMMNILLFKVSNMYSMAIDCCQVAHTRFPATYDLLIVFLEHSQSLFQNQMQAGLNPKDPVRK